MTCAKATVTCSLVLRSGDVVIGTNACANPQDVCPRAPGEGYAKCISVCGQKGHAEVQALAHATAKGLDVRGSTAIVTGHTYACQLCQEELYRAGVAFIGVR